MRSFADRAERLEGLSASQLAERLGVPRVELHASVGSTLDVAHAIAATAESGTLIVADEQTSGRGRHGRRWDSPAGAGIWLALVERPVDARALDVMALRCGLFAAEALDELATGPIGVKWPNDLYVAGRKLAGVLIETRWRGTAPEWVAIGFGMNVRPPRLEGATGLADGVGRLDALERLVPALRRAAAATRHLSAAELERWRRRDVTLGLALLSPTPGTAQGITASGELVVRGLHDALSRHRTGALTLAEPLPCS